jgi:polyphosphate:AMP phosphotransferase
MGKKEYHSQIKELHTKMSALQQQIKELDIPVCIVFEGWSASGKGTLINKILYPLDPRYFNVYSLNKVSEDIYMRPPLWSFFCRMPSRGRMTIFDKSWHRIALPGIVSLVDLNGSGSKEYFRDINSFEAMHQEDGTLIIKLFLHISKEEQKQRFKELKKNVDTEWRLNNHDLEQNVRYEEYLDLFQDMLSRTNTTESQWCIIEADDKRYATVKIFKVLISKIQDEVNRVMRLREAEKFGDPDDQRELITAPEVSILSGTDLTKTIGNDEYKEKIEMLQDEMANLEFALYRKRKSVVIVMEGWDAAGKGGSIKRLTEKLDPRGYEVIPVSAPTKEELAHHYLWRFYNKLPKDGHIAIFDRSWYGRVMVERVEGFCSTKEWQRAYSEINDMELHLHNHGVVIFKFWLQVDKEEQLARFKARQADPLKNFKITDEDWRNRDKWDMYEIAVNEMLLNTDTEYAPWTIVESNNKKYARVKILEEAVNKLKKELKNGQE